MSIENQLSAMAEYANKHGMPVQTIAQVPNTILKLWASGEVPCIHGLSGIGKTAIAKQLATGLEADYIVLDTSLLQPEDYLLMFKGEDGYIHNLFPWWVKQIEDNDKQGKSTVLLLDEVTRYVEGSASALFGIIGSKSLASYKFPESCFIYAACNPNILGFSVNDILEEQAWRRRLRHIAVDLSSTDFLEYAIANDFNAGVIDYLQSNMSKIYDLPAMSAGKIFACPASWEKVSMHLNATGALDVSSLATFLNLDIAQDFVAYIYDVDYKVDIATMLEDFEVILPVLNKIKAERGDLLAKLIDNVADYLYRVQPEVEKIVPSLVLFWGFVSAELKGQLNDRLTGGSLENGDYHALLTTEIGKTRIWKKTILPELALTSGG